MNAGASYRLPLGESTAVRFHIRAENIAGQDYYETGYRTPGRTALGGWYRDAEGLLDEMLLHRSLRKAMPRIYLALLRAALRIDRMAPVCPNAYAVIRRH